MAGEDRSPFLESLAGSIARGVRHQDLLCVYSLLPVDKAIVHISQKQKPRQQDSSKHH
jgi:hypothetical protein